MPNNMWEEVDQPWGITSGLWGKRVFNSKTWESTLLDHKELMGQTVGRTWLLSHLPRPFHVWNQHNGLSSGNPSLLKSSFSFCLV